MVGIRRELFSEETFVVQTNFKTRWNHIRSRSCKETSWKRLQMVEKNYTLALTSHWLLNKIPIIVCWSISRLYSKPGKSPNPPNFDDLYLRAQEELEARTTCVRKPWTWSWSRIKNSQKYFIKKSYSSISTHTKPKIHLHHPNRVRFLKISWCYFYPFRARTLRSQVTDITKC